MPIALGAPALRDRTSRARRDAESPPSPLKETQSTGVDDDWRAFQESGDIAARNRLVAHYMRTLVRPIARRIHGGLPVGIDIDDLVQQGYFGLVEAMSRFEAGRRFETFARQRISGSVHDYLRKIDHVPRLTRTRSKAFAAAVDEFRMSNGRPPTIEEIRPATDLPEAVLARLVTNERPAAMVQFSSVTPEGSEAGDFEADGMDAFEDDQDGPLQSALHQDIRDFITSGFDRRDRLIVILYYYEQMTMREVGASLGISESRVSQRLDSIHSCLRARLSRAGQDALHV